MRVLAIETSCDETSVAVIADGVALANVVSTQIKMHAEYGGVVPELATREHARNLLPVAREALRQAGLAAENIDAVAATQGPGLPNALLIGFHAGQSFALSIEKPFIGIHHHEAHLYSPWIRGTPPRAEFEAFEPNISLIVSGGHTLLVHVKGEQQHSVLGGTIDDAAGECFDKTAKLLGLPYPGGPHLDRLAAKGNPATHSFPRPMMHDAGDDFSYSGLKTSVRYFLQNHPEILNDAGKVADLCASVQAAIVEPLVHKLIRAAKRTGVKCVTASGGVTCNSGLRRALEEGCRRNRLQLRLAEPKLCTDNAAMIGILAERKLLRGAAETTVSAEIYPSWDL
ncbi:MAG TPA: tRNA (adenosine(37)-N6)-threonylcarbamoyltransferase complex transferase subunit TsaD [Methylomirabilota bacterium]|nr:tRNA (adenosine(37)-N6)-threonylcarbamoyltransferase complex transferase subunit TsaD [Methylomirabilota bacterium]